MRDALSPPRGIIATWDRFFFTPADSRPLGLMRIAVGALLLWNLGCLGLDLPALLGSNGWIDQAVLADARRLSNSWEWSLWDAVPDRLLRPAWVMAMVGLGCFTVGLGTRFTAPIAWVIAVSTTRRNPMILYGFDQVVTLWALYLAVTFASGQAFSVDCRIASRRGRKDVGAPSISANLGLRLTQVTLAIIYASAGLAKAGGVSWLDGSAVMKTLGNAEFRPFDLTGILASPVGESFLYLCTHLALWTELLYPILIWNRAFRPFVLGAAVLMHIGIALTMGLTEFSLAMLAGNLAFVQWGHGRKAAIAVQSPASEAMEPRPSPPTRRLRR